MSPIAALPVVLALLAGGAPGDPAPPAIALRADAPPAFGRGALSVDAAVEGDLNGDGRTDSAFTLRGDDVRYLVVALGEGKGLRRIGLLELDAYPLGPAALAIGKRGVLVVTDLTGGTSAWQTTYRYRYDARADRMRLIGQDVEFYSRTGQHGSTRLSRNFLTGASERQVGTLTAAGDQRFGKVRRGVGKPSVVYLEDSPDPMTALGDRPR